MNKFIGKNIIGKNLDAIPRDNAKAEITFLRLIIISSDRSENSVGIESNNPYQEDVTIAKGLKHHRD